MFAVIQSNGKQYKVKEGDIVDVELIDTKNDKKAVFSEVLLVGSGDKVKIGQPTVQGAEVSAEIIGEIKAKKVIAFKYRRREGYHRTVGHRQKLLRVKIEKIKG